jgi:hypothetical protein
LKTRRIASSLALAAALALGATGCSLIAPQGTLEPYAPSDGVDVTIENIAVRNLLLIADESGENFNVVFTGVNNSADDAIVRITFVNGSNEASADFNLVPGSTSFGNPDSDVAPQLVSIAGLKAGATVEAFFEVAGGGETQYKVPVLDGTLAEYQQYVLSTSQLRKLEKQAEADSKTATGETVQGETDAAAPAAPTE